MLLILNFIIIFYKFKQKINKFFSSFLFLKNKTQFDKDSIGKINYWPLQGFPAEKYPYTNQKHYLSPFVFIRLRDVRFNVPISIECAVHDKNIEIEKKERIGYLQFQLLIETEL